MSCARNGENSSHPPISNPVKNPGPEDPALICAKRGLITLSFLKCLKCSKVPKMPKVNEIFVSLKIDLAKGEHLNFSSP
jgi:hypothetical protein